MKKRLTLVLLLMVVVFMFTGCGESNSTENSSDLAELIEGDWKLIKISGDSGGNNTVLQGGRFLFGIQYVFSFDNGVLIQEGRQLALGTVLSIECLYTIQGNKLITVRLDDEDTANNREYSITITDDGVTSHWEKQIDDDTAIFEYEITITGDEMTLTDENGSTMVFRRYKFLDHLIP